MMKYKRVVVITCMSMMVCISMASAQVYSEFKNKKICHIPITLDMPEIDVPAFQWAIFDHDPVPGFRKRILDDYASWYPSLIGSESDPEECQKYRNGVIENAWGDEFQYIPGNEVYLYRGANDIDNWYNTGQSGDYWFVTQPILHEQAPICWSIPLKIQPGMQIDLVLRAKNAIHLGELFDEVMAESPLPRRHGLYSDMIDVLHQARTLYYETSVTWHSKDFEREYRYKVWLKKPNHARIEAYLVNDLVGTMVGDGENFWFFWAKNRPHFSSEDMVYYEATKKNAYLRLDARPGFHSIWHVINRTGGGMMAFQPSIFHMCHSAIDESIDSVIVYEKEMIGDELCDYIEVSYLDHQRSRYYWLGEEDHLPRKCQDVVRVEHEAIIEETWSNISSNEDMPDDLFIWSPPEAWTELVEPSLAAGLLPVGTPAPDFSFKTLDGSTFTLSACKGKVVLINFWRVGCPPCRDELPWLENMHQKFHGEGLVVVGYNARDDEQFIRELLEKHNVTYPNIYTTSEEARTVQFERYQKPGASAVPMNYVIDRKGKVAMAWYGHEPNNTLKIERLLQEKIE